jgi:hypothetical protein
MPRHYKRNVPRQTKPASKEYWAEREREKKEDEEYERKRMMKLSPKQLREEQHAFMDRETRKTEARKAMKEAEKKDRIRRADILIKEKADAVRRGDTLKDKIVSQSKGPPKPGKTDMSKDRELDEDDKLLLKYKTQPWKKLDDRGSKKVNKAAEKLKKKLKLEPLL